MHWKATTILICAYGIVKEFRPATPFLTPYLVSSFKNFTDVELYSEIYPFWTYSYLFFLVPIFFLTDILRYKPIIVLEALSLFGTWALLLWGKTVWHMQIMQILFGLSSAAEIAYYSYMYAVVNQKYYKLITSYIRAAALVGKFFAFGFAQFLISFEYGLSSAAEIAYYSYMYAVVNQKYYKLITSYIRAAALVGKFFAFGFAQFLISFEYGSYLLLNQISFGAVCIVLGIAAILPSIPSKIANNKVVESVDDTPKLSHIPTNYEEGSRNDQRNFEERTALSTNAPNVDHGIVAYFRSIWYHFKIFKRDKIVLKWSIWWALTSCGVFQVMNYVQTLWATMQTSSDIYNGITECANTFIGIFKKKFFFF
ncbi:unnamed protein product [Brugia pahangi]|uniref:Thiamine transporter 2 n=1 Tax=Brugia pahangi TaxID=6280 RepID=A0A0N4TYJ0_BRUPA|nr:unnamed protein product [Brugia pahangi]